MASPIAVVMGSSKQVYNFDEFSASELEVAEALLQLNPHSLPPLRNSCVFSRKMTVLPSWGRKERRTAIDVTPPSSSLRVFSRRRTVLPSWGRKGRRTAIDVNVSPPSSPLLQPQTPLLASPKVLADHKISSCPSSPKTPLLFPDDNNGGVNDANLAAVLGAKTKSFSAALPTSTNGADYLLTELSRQLELLKQVMHQHLLQPRKPKVEEEKKHLMPTDLRLRLSLPSKPTPAAAAAPINNPREQNTQFRCCAAPFDYHLNEEKKSIVSVLPRKRRLDIIFDGKKLSRPRCY